MRLKTPKQCGCGKVHREVPRDAKHFTADALLAGYYWQCRCWSTLFAPEDEVERARHDEMGAV